MTVPTRPADVGRLARAVTAAGLGGLGLLVAAPASHAVTVPPGVYVVDEAGVLSTSDEQRLTPGDPGPAPGHRAGAVRRLRG